jgi:hypothetical protein
VANPTSPDGTHDYLSAVARTYPHVRLREVEVPSQLATNKGAMINRAFETSRGEWIWLTDADCLFSTGAAAMVLEQVGRQREHLFYGERRHLSPGQAEALIVGCMDGLKDFEELTRRAEPTHSEKAPWGYTQIVHRSVLKRVRYPEQFNHFAHSDGLFVDACKRYQMSLTPIAGLICLHLEHPFSWYGTQGFL